MNLVWLQIIFWGFVTALGLSSASLQEGVYFDSFFRVPSQNNAQALSTFSWLQEGDEIFGVDSDHKIIVDRIKTLDCKHVDKYVELKIKLFDQVNQNSETNQTPDFAIVKVGVDQQLMNLTTNRWERAQNCEAGHVLLGLDKKLKVESCRILFHSIPLAVVSIYNFGTFSASELGLVCRHATKVPDSLSTEVFNELTGINSEISYEMAIKEGFTEYTRVLVPDSSGLTSFNLKEIKYLNRGDHVLCYNKDGVIAESKVSMIKNRKVKYTIKLQVEEFATRVNNGFLFL